MPMNIVHTEASCGWGGQEIRILEESRGMIARGHKVLVLCPPESRIYAEGPKRGVPTVALPIGRRNIKGLLALRAWLRSHPVDVLNSHSSTDTWLAALACLTLAKAPPIVRTRHISSPIPDNAASRWLYTKAVRHVVTTGEELRRQVIVQTGADGGQVSSVPTGIDPDRFKPGDKRAAREKLGLDPDGRYIGIVATLRSWKGHLYLLEAFADLKADGWKLLVVGDGPMRERIEARIADLNLGASIILAGQQANPEDWLQTMDVFCLPSYANEGVPQALLQAMLTGLPIVTTPVGAILEAVSDQESALVVPPQDAKALAAALRRLLDDPELGARYGAKARAEAMAHHTEAAMLDAMETRFERVLHAS